MKTNQLVRRLAFVLASTLALSALAMEGWSDSFADSKVTAVRETRPLVLVWGNYGCTHCTTLEEALSTKDAEAWAGERSGDYVFCHKKGTSESDAKAAFDFCEKHVDSKSGYPYLCLYWKKANGKEVVTSFTCRWTNLQNKADSCGITLPGTSFGDDFQAFVDGYLKDYFEQEKIAFEAQGTADDRYEIEPQTEWVDIPVLRTGGPLADSTSSLVVYDRKTKTSTTHQIEWTAGETRKCVRVSLRGTELGYWADHTAGLYLYDAEGAKVAGMKLYMVNRQPNGPVNPYFVGETNSLAFGDWTMDLDLATNTVKSAGGKGTLVFFTGGLWCPHCVPLETNLLETARFRAWAASNRLACVTLDNPKRALAADGVTQVDSYGSAATTGRATLSAVPTGPGPTLLRYDLGSNGRSGAAYRSRKMITDEAAEAVLQRNHDLGYAGGFFNAPSSFRTGYPTIYLLDPDGRIRGWLARHEGEICYYVEGVKKTIYTCDPDENMRRFDEFLKLAETGTPENSYAVTTELEHAVGGETTVELSLQQHERYYRVSFPHPGTFAVSTNANTSTNAIVFTLAKVQDVSVDMLDGDGESVRTLEYPIAPAVKVGTNEFACAVTTGVVYRLGVSSYANWKTVKRAADDVSLTAGFASSLYVEPGETPVEIVSIGHPIGLKVSKGTCYRILGATSVTGPVTDEDPYYAATADGVASVSAETGSTVSLQVWKPGKVSFAVSSQIWSTADGTGTVKLVRTAGAAGAATVLVHAEGPAVDEGRCVWTGDREVSFEDGETEASFEIELDPPEAGESPRADATMNLTLKPVDTSAHAVAVDSGTNRVTIVDSSDPAFVETTVVETLWKYFANTRAYALRNVGSGTVSFKRVSGTVPAGLTVAYADGQAVLSWNPEVKTGTFRFALQIREKRGDETVVGNTATFTITVANPTKLNPYISANTSGGWARTLSTLVPLMAEAGDGGAVLAGTLSAAVTARNKISAKYQGTEADTLSYAGYWQSMSEDGTAYAELARGTTRLELTLTAEGDLTAVLTMGSKGGHSYFLKPGESLSGDVSVAAPESFAAYKGYYTVQLPPADETTGGQTLAGCGILRVRMTSKTAYTSGTVQWAGVMPDGTSVSGSSKLGTDASSLCTLPVFARKDETVVGLVAGIRKGAATAWQNPDDMTAQQLIAAWSGTQSYLLRRDEAETYLPLETWGGVFATDMTPNAICHLFNYSIYSQLAFDASRLAEGDFGAVVSAPSAKVKALKTDAGFSLSKIQGGDLTIGYTAGKGQFTGKAEITFTDGSAVNARYYGILLPGWLPCEHCGEEQLFSRPFGAGTVFWDEGGIRRSAAVTLKATRLD